MYSEIKIIIIWIIVLLLAVGGAYLYCINTPEIIGTEYAQTTVVVNLDRENDIVTCKDFNGILWQFEGCEDWTVNDIASMIMNDNGTEIIYDDIIVSVKYDGWIDGWF